MNTKQTIWKDIEGYEGLYQVSDTGLVRSKNRTLISLDGKSYRYTGKLFKPKKHKAGYYFVELTKNGKRRNHYVHRIVAQAFIPNPENKPQVNHLNGVKTDNDLLNLEWATQLENNQHAVRSGLTSSRKRRISWAKCVKDLRSGLTFESLKDAAKHYNCNYFTLKSQLRRGTCGPPLELC